ncbi:MAG TPA: SMC family ATPase, partial [Gemmataceae bacterium]|nr:SMC family ATPase [Gemmataceae bacterium]
MIPQRVKLKGFLCYMEEQEVAFHDRSLWMLAGTNGSGKSSIFDAVTYALFGHHRGGSQHAGELINKDSNSLNVEFEFLLDGQMYRIRRTLQRNPRGNVSGTQLISRRRPGPANGQPGWDPLEDTSRKVNFDSWVRENIGLNYETFTSSVLLLQGKAEKLLDSTAKGRFEVLAGIVDLEHYERLHRRADELRRNQEDDLKALKGRLAILPEVTAQALADADGHIATAEAARQEAQAEVERRQALEFQARQWADLQTRLAAARQRWQQAEQLLADAAAIEKGARRLQELRAVLPHVQVVFDQRQQLQESERKTGEVAKQKQKLEDQLAEQGHALEQTRQKRTSLQNFILTEEQHRRDVAGQFRQAAVHLEKVKESERQANDLAWLQADLGRLPADADEALRRAREVHDRLGLLGQTVPLLARLHAQREELRLARVREETAGRARLAVQGRGEQYAAEVERLRPRLEEAARVRQQADAEATRSRTLLEQATRDLNELVQLEGAKVCRHCGQALTPGHVQEEKGRRQSEVAAATKHLEEAMAGQQAAQRQEQELRDQLTGLEKKLGEAREEFLDQRQQAEQARKDVDRLQRECGQAYGDLPEAFRNKVSPAPPADWLVTAYPTGEELAAARQEAGGLAVAHQRLHEAVETQQQRNNLLGQEATIRQSLARLQAELPADPQRVRQDHVRLEAEDQARDRSLIARRAEAAEVQKQLDRLSPEREQTQQQWAELNGRLGTEERARQHCRQVMTRALKELPPDWRALAEAAGLAKLYGWTQERDQLTADRVEERARQLQQTRLGLEVLRQERAALEGQQEQFPAEARQEPARLQELLEQGLLLQRARDDELGQARQHKRLLESHQQQRQYLEEEGCQQAKEHAHSKCLAELLGRDRLQLHLVRQAERQVVDFANAVLDRLSGGQLYLRLCGEADGEGNTAKALELEAYNRTTGDKPINVAFLSGSQKFRVAVSLALGIGQYASRQHRPIESVIIDEGFGCLDKEGRQVMIQELQNL